MAKAKPQKRTYDRYFKGFMGLSLNKNIVRFINKFYDDNLPLDSEVTRLETETTDSEGELRRSDFIIKVAKRVFHIEIESGDGDNDGTMILRMVEYGFRSAFMHGKLIEGNKLTLHFPAPVVIYLRDSEKTQTEFIVEMVLSNGKSVSQEIPVKRLSDYTAEDLFDEKLFALSLFYPLRYELLLRNNHTVDDESRFSAEITSLLKRADVELEKGEISSDEYDLILEAVSDITKRVVLKSNILNRKGIDEFMEQIQEKYNFELLGIRIAEKEETAITMIKAGEPIEKIINYSRLTREKIETLRLQLQKKPQ